MNKICLGYFQHNSKFLKWLFFFSNTLTEKCCFFQFKSTCCWNSLHCYKKTALKITSLTYSLQCEAIYRTITWLYLTVVKTCFFITVIGHIELICYVSAFRMSQTPFPTFSLTSFFFFFFYFLSVLLHPCSNLGWTVHSYGNPLDLRPGSLGQVAPSLLEGSPEHLFWKHCEPVQRNMVPGEEGRGIKTSRRYGRKPPLLAFTQPHMRLLWITTNSLHSLDYGVSEYWQKMYTTIALWPDQICSLSTSGFTFCLYWSTIRPILKVVAVCV